MLPKIKHTSIISFFIIFSGLVSLVILGQLASSILASHKPSHQSPIIHEPSSTQTITGFQDIKVYDNQAELLDIYLSIGFSNPDNQPCYTIAKGLTFENSRVNYSWDSTTVVDGRDYMLWVVTHYSGDHPDGDSLLLGNVENGKTGAVCSPPFEPPLNPPSPNSSTETTTPTIESSDNNPTSPTTSTSNEPKQTTETTSGSTSVKATEEKKVRKDALVIFDEEVPIELDRFDPDIFLKGENLEITKVLNKKVEGNSVVQFAGKTTPSTLVTLYIFSSPVVVVVKSDLEGNWKYNRETQFESGKHTVFATVYDIGVTRRSDIVDFFVVRGTREGQSLILSQSSLQNFYPYLFTLGFAVVAAFLTLILYRIYSKRKQIKT